MKSMTGSGWEGGWRDCQNRQTSERVCIKMHGNSITNVPVQPQNVKSSRNVFVRFTTELHASVPHFFTRRHKIAINKAAWHKLDTPRHIMWIGHTSLGSFRQRQAYVVMFGHATLTLWFLINVRGRLFAMCNAAPKSYQTHKRALVSYAFYCATLLGNADGIHEFQQLILGWFFNYQSMCPLK